MTEGLATTLANGPSQSNQKPISTKRLLLRRPDAKDADSIQAILGNHAIARMMIAVPQPFDRQDAEAIIARWNNPETRGWGYAITLRDDPDNRLIGLIWIVWRDERWRLAFWLSQGHWSKGIITEATNALVEAFFSVSVGERLYAVVIADNPASLKLQQKLGFSVVSSSQTWSISRNEMVNVVDTELTFGGFIPL